MWPVGEDLPETSKIKLRLYFISKCFSPCPQQTFNKKTLANKKVLVSRCSLVRCLQKNKINILPHEVRIKHHKTGQVQTKFLLQRLYTFTKRPSTAVF